MQMMQATIMLGQLAITDNMRNGLNFYSVLVLALESRHKGINDSFFRSPLVDEESVKQSPN